MNNYLLFILLLIVIYILKYHNKLNVSYDFILYFFITLILICTIKSKKEPFTEYPESIYEEIDTFKYININKKLKDQKRVYTLNSYHKNDDMYSLDYEDINCHPLEVPSTFYNKNK